MRRNINKLNEYSLQSRCVSDNKLLDNINNIQEENMIEKINLTNYEKFLRIFNTLHEILGEKLNQPNMQFGELLKVAERNNDKVVMNYEKELDFYREFRNLLRHQATINKPPAAEPN